MRTFFRFALFTALVVAACLLLAMSIRSALTRPLLFPAPDYRFRPMLPGGKMIVVPGERKAYGYYAAGGKKLIVFFHGNGEVMGSMQDLAAKMLGEGFSVLLTEYPGYGFASAYTASERNIYTDNTALLKHVQGQFGHEARDTILWGFSLGTGVAVEMAARQLGQRLVLMAPFTSMPEVAAHHFSALARLLVVDIFNSGAKAPQIPYPVLLVHGTRDSVLPYRMGEELARRFVNARLLTIHGADHNDLMLQMSAGDWKTILSFAADKN